MPQVKVKPAARVHTSRRHGYRDALAGKCEFSVTEAKAHLGDVVTLAFSSPEPVTIRTKSGQFVILKPMTAPAPVEVIPPGSYTIDDAWAARLNEHPSDEFNPGAHE